MHTITNDLLDRIRFRGDPVANPKNVVVRGKARFTVLTERMIRLEWSETGEFEDRGTYAFPTRFATAPEYTVKIEEDRLVIRTSLLEVGYKPESGRFNAENLSITYHFNNMKVFWVPGTPNLFNLRGTRRTLDVCEGEAALEEGLFSRAGWTLFDDSRAVVFNIENGWVAPRPDYEIQDWYFMAFGHDFQGGLAEYLRFGGAIPLIPCFVLGAWWSRFWAYSAQDLKDLVSDFAAQDLPLDVLVIDMDWHTPHSWTGYTWNRELFPDPAEFLAWVHGRGLRATLNLHPAEGVQSFEEIYPRFAAEMRVEQEVSAEQEVLIDPTSQPAVPFQITRKPFVKNYFELIHHPMEDQGVDFWWMDWQQGDKTEMKGLDALLWLNHLHFNDSTRRGKRPMLYSRWGGLGNHRNYIGFSGDTVVGWEALQFQPYFTATAANVAYGWWSHDIGGHMGGVTEPELYARWVQFGALSPCLRLHATKDPRFERRPWMYPPEVFQAAKTAFHLRYQLVPYLYSMARLGCDTGIALCRPVYYEYPDYEDAYAARYQYYLGDQMIAAPIVFPADPMTGLAAIDVWIPPGTWIDFNTKETFTGPRWVRLLGDIQRVPLLVKEGAIVPQSNIIHGKGNGWGGITTDQLLKDNLVLSVFPGKEGKFRLYEDDGITQAYQQGQFEWTEITTRMDRTDTWKVCIAAVEGRCDGLPEQRSYEIRLEGSRPPEKVLLDGVETRQWTYTAQALVTRIVVPARNKRQPTFLTVIGKTDLSAAGEVHNRQLILSDLQKILGDRFTPDVPIFQPTDSLQHQSIQSPKSPVTRLPPDLSPDALARLGGPFARVIEFVTPEEASLQLGRVIVGAPADSSPYDLKVDFTLFKGSESQNHTIRRERLTQAQIINAPFAWDGLVQTAFWQVEVTLTWKDQTWTIRHCSDALFPTISSWQFLYYNPANEPITIEKVINQPGHLNELLMWKAHVQTAEGLRNIKQPHMVMLARETQEQIKAGEPAAAYLATTLINPVERVVTLLFQGEGDLTFYLNGEKIESDISEAGQLAQRFIRHPFYRSVRQLPGIRLRRGENTLVIHTRPLPDKPRAWYLGGALVTPAGEVITDLLIL